MRVPTWILAVLLVPASVCAHDLWLDREGDAIVLRRGHLHSGHAGEEIMPYSPSIVVRASCFNTSGRGAPLSPVATDPVRFDARCAVTYVLTSTGYWTKTPYGTKNVPRTETTQPVESWLSFEGVKRIDVWSDSLAVALTGDLELVPTQDPLPLSGGDKLRLLVTFEKQPVGGAVVLYDGKPRGTTGPDGRINIRLRHAGFQYVEASLSTPSDAPECDKVVRTTALVFEVRE